MKRIFWVGLVCLSVASVFFIPVEFLRDYGTIWATLALICALYFVFGYLMFSTGWRSVRNGGSEDGQHLLFFPAYMGLVLLFVTASRLFVPNMRPPEGPVLYQVTAACLVYIIGFWGLFWRASLFTRRQIAARRKLREEAGA